MAASDGIVLRKAGPNDAEFAYSVRKAAFKEYAEKVSPWDEDEQLRLHERRYREQDYRVVCESGVAVGIAALVVTADCLNLHQLFILPEHQAKRIGHRAMLLIMEEARRLGLPVRLRVLKVNPRASAFYRRLGFEESGETETHRLFEWSGL